MLFTSTTGRRRHQLLGLLVVGGLLAASCSNSGDKAGSTTTAAPATTAAPGTTAGGTEPANTTPTSTTLDIGSFQSITGVPGVTDKEIDFAVLGTGPANPLGYCLLECFQAGVQAYFDYRNSLGGIHGRQLVVKKVVDDELANNKVKSLELADATDIFGVFDAPLLYDGVADLGKSGIPTYSTYPATGDADGFANVYIPSGELCTSCNSPMTVQEAVLAKATKVASIGFGVSQASKDCTNRVKSDIDKWGPDAGVQFVYKNDNLPFGFPNGLGPEVTAMKAAGVNLVVTCVDQNSALILEQELERQGLGSSVVVVLPQGYGDTGFITKNASLLEGDLLGTAYRPLEADQTGTNLPAMTEWIGKTGKLMNDYAIQGWLDADLAVSGLLAAGPKFDRAGVVAATNKITAWTAGGIVPPVDWTKAHTTPKEGEPARLCQSFVFVKGGKTALVGDPDKPFYCFDLPLAKWAPPTQESFK